MTVLHVSELRFERMLGLEYFDGPMSGIGVLSDTAAYYFRIVGWDEDHDERVFAAAEIPSEVADRLWRAFESVETPHVPKWYPQSDGTGAARAEIDAIIAMLHAESGRSGFRKLMLSRELTERIICVELENRQHLTLQEMVSAEKLVQIKSPSDILEVIHSLHL